MQRVSQMERLPNVLLVFAIMFMPSISRITIFEPKALKFLYFGQQIKYSVMNFGRIPYGRSISGIVYKGQPSDGCSPLASVPHNKTQGNFIILLERGICNFAEKVLNAQKIGASLVFITDNADENVHKIFPVERTRSVLDQVHIPSLLLSKIDGDQIRTAIELQETQRESEAYGNPIELGIHFDLNKSNSPAKIRIILQVDDPQSYDLISQFYEYYKTFKHIIDLKIHFKLFLNADLPFKNDECIKSGKDTFCILKSNGDTKEVPGLISETVKQMCLNNLDFTAFVEYSRKLRVQCFTPESEIVSNFQECVNDLFQEQVPKEFKTRMTECMKFGSSENEIILQNNYEETKYFLINYSPLLFINGFYYKGNFDDVSHLFETICNSFEETPAVCNQLEAFMVSEDTNYAKLVVFMSAAFVSSIAIVVVSLLVFYIFYKRRMRKRFVSELNDKISKALMNHRENSDRSSCKRLENQSKSSVTNAQSIN